jgi:hypothetical protein
VATAVLTLIAPAIVAHAGYRYILFRDGIKFKSPYGMSAVESQVEYDLIRWFRHNGSEDDLVIAPDAEISWMLATAPVHAMAPRQLL